MTKIRLFTYAIWIRWDYPNQVRFEKALHSLWTQSLASYTLHSRSPAVMPFTPWIKVSNDLYLLHTSDRTSPGDVCGTLQHIGGLGPGEEALAFLLHPDPIYSYIPAHAMGNKALVKALQTWKDQAADWYLEG
jgi:hypothetical protein